MIITSLEELSKLKLKYRSSIDVKCDICGKIFKTRTPRQDLHCKGCKTYIVKKQNGTLKLSEETKQKISKSGKGKHNNKVSDETRNKRKETCLKRYGGEPLSNKDIRRKIESTCLEKYGAKTFGESEEGRQRLKNAAKESNEKRMSTVLEKYGVKCATLIDGTKKTYTYDNEHFDSKWELAFWIYCKDNNFDIKRCDKKFTYIFENTEHIYYPDFIVNGEIIEIKGPQFFENGKMINPFDRTQDNIYEAKHQCMINNNINIIKNCKKYIDYVNNKYTKDYLLLFKNNIPFPYPKLKSDNDFDVIRFYHKSLYDATRKGKKSPKEAWNDKQLVKDAALNRLKYIGSCSPCDIVAAFSVAKIAPKVSIFKPYLAKYLINKYLSEYSEVYDPFSGFSGRAVAAARCNKIYKGYDINLDHIKESNEIIKHLNLSNCYVKVQDILKKNDITYGDCLFTCPPYGGKEHWNENNDEVEKSCDEWIDICLEKYKCKKYLFVVDKTEKYKDKIVEEIVNRSHFGTNKEYIILI